MKPLTKMSRQIVSAAVIPTLVRDAFRVAMEERPGPVHLELPEDIAGEDAGPAIVPPHPIELPVAHHGGARPRGRHDPGGRAPAGHDGCGRAAARVWPPACRTSSAGPRSRSSPPRWAKAPVTGGSNLYMGTAALSERDYVHEAIDRADLILAIGHDTVEKPPFIMGERARR